MKQPAIASFSQDQRRYTADFVRYAIKKEAPLLAPALARYAAAEGISWEDLALRLGCSPDELNAIAVCQPPRMDRFAEDVRTIAGTYVESDRLLGLLRQIQVLGALAERASLHRNSEDVEDNLLLAARDPDEQEPVNE